MRNPRRPPSRDILWKDMCLERTEKRPPQRTEVSLRQRLSFSLFFSIQRISFHTWYFHSKKMRKMEMMEKKTSHNELHPLVSLRCCRRNVLTRVLFSSLSSFLSSSKHPSVDDGSSHFLRKQQNAMTKDTRLDWDSNERRQKHGNYDKHLMPDFIWYRKRRCSQSSVGIQQSIGSRQM